MARSDPINILVVDDMPEKLLVYQTILEELGENLVCARSGAEALKQVLRQEFAVILLDVNMPGMDGFETAALLRRRKRSAHTPIIFVTAYADDMNMAEGYTHGAVDYILSPVVPEVLKTKVRVFVDLFRLNQRVMRRAEERAALAGERARRAAAEEATRRAAFLAEASTQLASSLDLHACVHNLARLSIPFLADIAVVCLADEQNRPGETEWAWNDGAAAADPRLLRGQALPEQLRNAIQRVLATGDAERFPGTVPGDDAQAAQLGPALVLLLVARAKRLGVLVLAHTPCRGDYPAEDVALAEDLACRGAMAIDNARLYQDVQQNDRRKDEFLAMLAHELRNPLAPICNAVQVLRLSAPGEAELSSVRDVIDRQVRHLVRLVDDLLDVSRITRGKIRVQRELIDVAAVVSSAIETTRPIMEARRHELSTSLPAEPLRLSADPARMAQVLSNLLHNAAKYTEEKGRIYLAVEHENGEVVFRVRDTGVGISPDILPCVFDLFIQADRTLDRSQGGLGIGLTLVRRLVELHGGRVQAFSEGPGRGSEFVVRLPAVVGAPPEQPATGSREPPTVGGAPCRVLVVDDNIDAAETLAVLLRIDGHDTQVAHDGRTAISLAHSFRPAVVLLDIGLPGMDGYEVARRLRSDNGAEPLTLVAITGYGQEQDRQRSREAGFDLHLVKPIALPVLRELLVAPAPATGHDARPLVGALAPDR